MFVTDLQKEFYSLIKADRVLVFVNNDVDSICSMKILQNLFKTDHVLYTLLPITGKKDLYNEYNKHKEGYKYILMINCGATLDLYEFFDLEDDVTIFVADYHRPIEVTNIYNDGQIRLLHPQDTEELLPEYQEIFRDSDSEESESEEEDEYGEKRPRYDETALIKRRDRREWEENRQRILFQYMQYSSYGSSTALLFYLLSWKLKRDSNDLLWWAIVGSTECLVSNKIEEDKYLVDSSQIQNHVARLNSTPIDQLPKGCLKISFERSLKLNLLRHWTLMESIKHTAYTAMKFKLFSIKGERLLLDFLADLGIPLIECKQKYNFMDSKIRDEVPRAIEAKMEKYDLEDIFHNTFSCQFGYQHKYAATDFVQALGATLEFGDANFDPKQAVYEGLDMLSRTNSAKLSDAIEKARDQTVAIVKMAQNILDSKQITSAGPFLYSIIQEGTPNICYLSRHSTIKILAYFLQQGHISNSRSRKAADLPLILVAPVDENNGLSVVVGIPPFNDKTRKNFFGKAFEQTVKNTQTRFLIDYWDSSLIQIKTEDRSKFLDGLVGLLS